MYINRVNNVIFLAVAFLQAACAPRSDWVLFVPPESEYAHCKISTATSETPSKQPAIRLSSEGVARFGAAQAGDRISVQQGDRFRLSALVKPGKNLRLHEKFGGVVLRATLFTPDQKDYRDGHFHVNMNGARIGQPMTGEYTLLNEWSEIEGVLEVPSGVTSMKFFVFLWGTSGEMLIDSPKITKL